jgi:transposase-like protein
MARPVNRARWKHWRRLIAKQRVSGLSVAEFCRRENVSRQGFHVWKRKVRRDRTARQASSETARAPHSRQRRAHVAAPRPFRRELARPALPGATSGFLQLPVTAVRPTPWIELALPDGTVVRLPQQNLAALAVVLRALRGQRLELSEDAGSHA